MIADLALKAFQGFAAGKAAKNQGKAQKVANEAKYKAEGDLWRSREAHRATGNDAASALLGNIQPTLQKGAPNYQPSPGIQARMNEARPFPGSLPADPTAGSTWALLGGLAGGGAQALDTYQMGRLMSGGKSTPIASAIGGNVMPGGNDEDTAYGPGQVVNRPVGTSSDFGGGEDRARVCALSPSLPGCK